MIFATGGLEFGAISTKSKPLAAAILKASLVGNTPSEFPSSSMTLN
jgi:hypothetical protein